MAMNENKNETVPANTLTEGTVFRTSSYNRRTGVTRLSQWYTVSHVSNSQGPSVVIDLTDGNYMVLPSLTDVEVQA